MDHNIAKTRSKENHFLTIARDIIHNTRIAEKLIKRLIKLRIAVFEISLPEKSVKKLYYQSQSFHRYKMELRETLAAMDTLTNGKHSYTTTLLLFYESFVEHRPKEVKKLLKRTTDKMG